VAAMTKRRVCGMSAGECLKTGDIRVGYCQLLQSGWLTLVSGSRPNTEAMGCQHRRFASELCRDISVGYGQLPSVLMARPWSVAVKTKRYAAGMSRMVSAAKPCRDIRVGYCQLPSVPMGIPASGSNDQTVRCWNVSTGLASELCEDIPVPYGQLPS